MVRNYRPDPVAPDKLERIMRAARSGPSAGFSQGQSFVVVQEEERRRRIAEIVGEPGYLARGFDPWLSVAPVHVVCCTSEAAYHRRYNEPDKLDARGRERQWPVPFWYVDAGCSLMMLLLAAVDEGLAAGFLGLTDRRTARLKELLGIPEEVVPVGLVTLGLPAPDRPSSSLRRGRNDPESAVRWEHW
jgi:nitroreductase